MFKINLSDEIKEAHKKYFEENIIPKLEKNKIEFVDDDILEFNKSGNEKYFKDYIQTNHDDFIQYCIYNKGKISIGNFQELENINKEINRLFPVVTRLINDGFVFSKANKKNKEKKYWEVLFELFGYKEFCDCSLFTVIADLAKYNRSIDKLDTYQKRKDIQEEMRIILKELFPQIAEKVDDDDNFMKTNFRRKKVIINMKEFKLKLMKYEKDYSLALTIDNYQKNIFKMLWNAYMFVFSTGIRTCPYCNRQYITPVLTSSGQVRGTLDHFLVKSEHPYFSMSLYNLVPTCYSCNSSLKGDTKFDFRDISPYEESMDSYVRFHANILINKPIHINVSTKSLIKEQMIKKHIDTYKLESQYNYHINQVEELILKRFSYSDEYIEDIRNKKLRNFKITKRKIKEQLIGYTEDQLKINDEPLSKFRRDIIEQLNFFDDSDLYLINKLEEILGEHN